MWLLWVLFSFLFFLLSTSLLPFLLSQGSGPEDFSHLPPEQRRKKLQGKLDELNKDIQKEMDQRYLFEGPFIHYLLTHMPLESRLEL